MIQGHMATYPARRDRLDRQVRHLATMVDYLVVVLNEYDEIPDVFANLKNVMPIVPEEDLKDTGKFLPLSSDPDDIVVLFDDDIDYPDDYVERIAAGLKEQEARHGIGHVAVGYHGTIYRPFWPALRENLSRTRGPFDLVKILLRPLIRKRGVSTVVLSFTHGLAAPRRVHQLGTGTLAVRSAAMPGFEQMKTAKRMVDIRLAVLHAAGEICQVALPRPEGWLRQGREVGESIWSGYTRRYPDEVMNEIARLSSLLALRAGES